MPSSKLPFLRPTNLRSPSAKAFWQGLAEERLLAQSCRQCETRFFPARPLCPDCLSGDLESFRLSGRGSLHSWTKVHRAGPEIPTPFLLGLIDLEEGLGRLTAVIVDAAEERLEIGMPVHLAYLRAGSDLVLYCIAVD